LRSEHEIESHFIVKDDVSKCCAHHSTSCAGTTPRA
jgi:hypothetical protein